MSEPVEKSQGEKITDERRRHNQAVEQPRGEYAPGREVDAEYQTHMRRLQEIYGPDEETIVDGRRTL